ncbi:MAG: glycosyltransferase family 87 protein [Coxiellaceae bacterium]|nr:glycosyltransferase family 87 protein [Coxiellaceae bacterium]
MLIKNDIKAISTFIFIGFIFSIAWHYYASIILRLGYPYNTFLFMSSDRFMDFFNSYNFLKTFTYINQPLNCYFPLTFWVFYPFTLLSPHISFILFNLIFVTYVYFLMFYFTKNMMAGLSFLEYHLRLIVLIFFSFPFLYAFDRGNIEILVFIFLSCSLFLININKCKLSVLFLVLASGMKLYPAIFAILYLKKKKYLSFFLFVFLLILFLFMSSLSLHGGFYENLKALSGTTSDISKYSFMMGGIRQSASIMSVIKAFYVAANPTLTYIQFQSFLAHFSKIYFLLSILFLTLTLFFILKEKNLSFWKEVTLLSLLIILLPPVSFDYKFIHFFFPLALFLQSKRAGGQNFNKLYLFYFAILFIPKNYYLFSLGYIPDAIQGLDGNNLDFKVSISVFLDVFIMLSFFSTILIEQFFYKTKDYSGVKLL